MRKNMQTEEVWLVCGGRDFTDQAYFNYMMSNMVYVYGMPKAIVHGDARGADRMAGDWARRHDVIEYACPADWDTHKKAAGPIRNREMMKTHNPDRVIAFPGGKGTADMVSVAESKEVWFIKIPESEKYKEDAEEFIRNVRGF